MSVSAPESPPKAAMPSRECPRCGAPLAQDQGWCLGCGSAVSTRVERPRGWRLLAGVMGAGFLVALAALAVGFAVATDDPATEVAATPTPATATPTAAPTVAPETSATPESGAITAPEETVEPVPTIAPDATPEPDSGGTTAPETPASGGDVAAWPEGEAAWTVVLFSAGDRATARAKATELSSAGLDVGILDSDDFASLRGGYWVVFSGQYEDAEQASDGLASVTGTAPDAYIRHVEPR
jgi:hypothetical protein